MKLNYPFAIISDIHMNDWSQFSHIREDKINSRLWETMEAVMEVCVELAKAGGNDLVITGDLFHTRGKIKPSVFNPVHALFAAICKEQGFNVWFLPGNHDLEGKDSDTIGNAVTSFSEIPSFSVFNEITQVGDFVFLPWIEHKDDFIKAINAIEEPQKKVLFCHIGIDGVLDNVSGKVGKAVFDRGFRYVFSGDYHNFKALGNGVYSVGALTHHSFGDINSTAGYLLVSETGVTQHETKAPKFVNGGHKLSCMGNIVRLSGTMTEEEAASAVKEHYDYGAKYVQDLTVRPSIKDTSASTVAVRVDLDIDTALESYTKHRYGSNYAAVLEEARRLKNEHV
jgi:DNA repair exonuclease SbcCD nuclease subunit